MEAISLKEYSKIKHEIFTNIEIEFQGKKFEIYKNFTTEYNGLKSKSIGSHFKINNTITRSSKKSVINYILKN